MAGRYRLQERLRTTPDYSVWRGTDETLDRPVTVRVVRPGHPGAADMVDAGRRAALVEDHRLVRVLDAGINDTGAYLVLERPTVHSLTEVVAHGPLPAPVARRLIGEAAQALDRAAQRGLHHLSLLPDHLLTTEDGQVLITGLAVDAALTGADRTGGRRAEREDTIGLVRLLYTALTGRWPGPADGEPGLPPAPTVSGRLTPPADLVPGVPNDLDTLCHVTLGPYEDGPFTPAELAAQLAPWYAPAPLSGAWSLRGEAPTSAPDGAGPDAGPAGPDRPVPAAPRARVPHPPAPDTPAVGLAYGRAPITPSVPAPPTGPITLAELTADPAAAAERAADPAVPGLDAVLEADLDADAATRPQGLPLPAETTGTEATGTEVDAETDADVDAEAVTQAMPLEAVTQAVPIDADTEAMTLPGSGTADTDTPTPRHVPGPLRSRPRTPPAADEPSGSGAADTGSWLVPVARDEPPAPFLPPAPLARPPADQTRFVMLLVGAAVSVGLLLAVVSLVSGGVPGILADSPQASVAVGPTSAATAVGDAPAPRPGAPTTTPALLSPGTGAVRFASVQDLDPQGDGAENSATVDHTIDGDPATTWRSQRYTSPTFGGLKQGLGLYLSLSSAATVHSVTVQVPEGSGGKVELRTSTGPHLEDSTVVATGTVNNGEVALTPTGATMAAGLIVWFTELPQGSTSGDYRVVVSEISLT